MGIKSVVILRNPALCDGGEQQQGLGGHKESLGGMGREFWGVRQGHTRDEGTGWGCSGGVAGLPWGGLGCQAEGAEEI